MYPELFQENQSKEDESEPKELSIEEELAREVEAIKSRTKTKKDYLFQGYDTGCKGVVFIAFQNDKIDPLQFVTTIFKDIEVSKQARTRY